FSLERLDSVEVALRVDRDAVRRVELARLPATVTECGELVERLTIEDVDFHVRAVGNIQESLLPVAREGDVPDGAGAARRVRDDCFLHERAVLLEHLNAIVLRVADVDQAVVRQFGAEYWTSELLGWRATRL